ncbi:hypothetical protein [Paraburkholderia dinghuensis]|uniref:Uncharacterized protein n=1 Tax=Paraburkholderia dinghuensis TaxID=2305225 RepID=A0A3N6MJP1_9BURK|nr:hypothetical protein [Paraburkholderia dinghuensis]RQH01515.1 hypothetical protein D1Y85_23230 [Paraburkholderia dinghuensis]
MLQNIAFASSAFTILRPDSRPAIRDFVNAIGHGLRFRHPDLTADDVEDLVTFSASVLDEETRASRQGVPLDEYLALTGGVADNLVDYLQQRKFIIDGQWRVRNAVLLGQLRQWPERAVALTLYAHALLRVDHTLTYVRNNEGAAAFDAMAIAASCVVHAGFYLGVEAPLVDGAAIDIRTAKRESAAASAEGRKSAIRERVLTQ